MKAFVKNNIKQTVPGQQMWYKVDNITLSKIYYNPNQSNYIFLQKSVSMY